MKKKNQNLPKRSLMFLFSAKNSRKCEKKTLKTDIMIKEEDDEVPFDS